MSDNNRKVNDIKVIAFNDKKRKFHIEHHVIDRRQSGEFSSRDVNGSVNQLK